MYTLAITCALLNREFFSNAVAREDHSQNDCFVLVVMSHGTEGKVYAKVSTGYGSFCDLFTHLLHLLLGHVLPRGAIVESLSGRQLQVASEQAEAVLHSGLSWREPREGCGVPELRRHDPWAGPSTCSPGTARDLRDTQHCGHACLLLHLRQWVWGGTPL